MNKVPLLTGGKHDTRHRPQTSTGAVNSLYNIPYTTYGWDDVLALAANPYGFADKDHVWALMPCDYAQIDLREAKPDNSWKFHYLSADLDTGDYPKEKVVAAVRAALGPGVQFLVYSTFSAWTGKTYETFDENTGEIIQHTESKGARWAVIVWLAQPVPTVAFAPLGKALLDLLVAQGVEVEDRSSAQPKRLRYLPARHLDGTGAYDYHVEPGQLLTLTGSHPLVTLSKAYIDQEAVDELSRVARAQKYAEQGKDEGPLSRHAAYRRKHPTTLALMEWLGFESIDGGVNWHHHAQGTKSYATELFPDGGLYTRSATVGSFGGAYDKNGGWYFQDTYDIYCAMAYHGNKEAMRAYAETCLLEYPDPQFEQLVAFGRAILESGPLWCGDKPLNDIAVRQRTEELLNNIVVEKQHAEAMLRSAEEAKKGKHDGDWLAKLPKNIHIRADKMEWLAFNAPGMIGELVQAKAPNLKRHSLVPLMVGALCGIGFLCQGKYVSAWNEFVTPTTLLAWLVGDTGTGKSDATDMFSEMEGMVDAQYIRAKILRSLGSGQAVVDIMAKDDNPHLFLLHNEGGGARSVGKGDKHQEGVFNETTDLHTAFMYGVKGSHTKTSGSTGALNNPTLASLSTSTPDKLFSTIDGADAEAGWMGRQLFVPLRTADQVEFRQPAFYSDGLKSRLNALCAVGPIVSPEAHPDVWCSVSQQKFHLKHYTKETEAYLREASKEYDKRSRDEHLPKKERAILGRANELVNRVTLIAGLATGGQQVPVYCAQWAKMLVDACLEFTCSKMDRALAEGEELSPSAKVRFKVKEYFEKVCVDSKFRNSIRGTKDGPEGTVWISLAGLKKKLRDNIDAGSGLINTELKSLLDDEVLVQIPEVGTNRTWLAYHG